MHGVFGYGLDTTEDQAAALLACHTLLKPGGWLILGWQTDLSAEPLEMDVVRAHFQVTGWRKTFAGSPVVFDLFLRAGSVGHLAERLADAEPVAAFSEFHPN